MGRNRKGFTLVEIIVVLIMIGILVTIAVPNYQIMMKQGATKAAQNNLISIFNAQKNFYLKNHGYCTTLCDTLADINLPANLNLNITDNNFTYNCITTGGFQCTATNGSIVLTLSNNPIIVTGGTTCASSKGSNPGCNHSCTSAVYCP